MVLGVLVFLVVFGSFSAQLSQDAYLSTPAMITRYGYPVEKHTAITEDGFMLQLHRIPGGRRLRAADTATPRKVVLMVSGLFGSSSDFVIMGPKRSLGFMLADEGYDVWMGNLRGDYYTKHKYMKRDSPRFWDYSYHEHGTYDLPASIDKVLSVTNSSKLMYIGYSMGTTSYFVMTSMRPEYNDKVVAFIALAPAVYLDNVRPLAKMVEDMGLRDTLTSRGMNHISIREDVRNAVVSSLCQARNPRDDICLRLLFAFVGEDYDQADWERYPVVLTRFQPASLKQLLHFSQLAMSGEFSEYSEQMMGKPYNISANTRPVVVYYGENDQLTEKSQVMRLVNKLNETGTLNEVVKVPWHKFNHLDFAFAKDVHKLLNRRILKTLPQLYDRYGS